MTGTTKSTDRQLNIVRATDAVVNEEAEVMDSSDMSDIEYITDYGERILPSGKTYSLDDRATGLNNNLIICGSPGSNKTRGCVIPNLLNCQGSYIVTDPKGNLYRQYHEYLESKGYRVLRVSFTHPEVSAHWNPLRYLKSTHDILKITNVLIYDNDRGYNHDPFWDEASQFLLNAVIAYTLESFRDGDKRRTFHTIPALIRIAGREKDLEQKSELNSLFLKLKALNPKSWAVKQWENVNIAPAKTFNTVCATSLSKFSAMDTEELAEMMSFDEVDLKSIGMRKTAVFIEASDTDRSMDNLLSLFFQQAISKLCELADEQENSQLPVPTTLIMDDFGTSIFLPDFDKNLANIRSRKISAVLVIQSLAQLEASYGKKASTIIDCCDRFCYLGGSDVSTAEYIATKVNKPVNSVLSMPLKSCWTFERGSAPTFASTLNLDDWMDTNGITEDMLHPSPEITEEEK